MNPEHSTYLLVAGVLVATLLQSWLLTLLAKQVARRWHFLDRPDDGRKSHARPTPLLGGVAVFAAFSLALAEYHLARWLLALDAPGTGPLTLSLLCSALLFCGLGVWDDKYGMPAGRKFLLQIAAALPFAWWGEAGAELNLLSYNLEIGWLCVPLTVAWVVACVNAVNLLDGLDGVASTVGIVISLTVAILAGLTGQPGIALVGLFLACSLAGFLAHNFPPASIFLGDAGSLTIGFLLSALAVEGTLKKAAGLPLLLPLMLLSIPAFDTLMAIMRRVLNGRGIGQGDRLHLHHCLKDRGLGPRQIILWFAVMCSVTGLGVIGSMALNSPWIAVATSLAVLAVLVGGRVFGYNETALLIRYLRMTARLFATATRNLQSQELLDRVASFTAEERLEIWRELREYVADSCGTSLEFCCENTETGDSLAYLNWRQSEQELEQADRWNLGCTRQRGPHARLRMEAVGENNDAITPQRLDYLLALLQAFCAQWPVPAQFDEAHPQLAGPHGHLKPQASELRLLRVQAEASRDTAAELSLGETPRPGPDGTRKAA